MIGFSETLIGRPSNCPVSARRPGRRSRPGPPPTGRPPRERIAPIWPADGDAQDAPAVPLYAAFRGRVRQAALQLRVAAGRYEPLVLRTNQKDGLANLRQPLAIVEGTHERGPFGRVTNRSPAGVLDEKPPAAPVEGGKVSLMVGALDRVPERNACQRSRNETPEPAQEPFHRAQSSMCKRSLQNGAVNSCRPRCQRRQRDETAKRRCEQRECRIAVQIGGGKQIGRQPLGRDDSAPRSLRVG